jgi:Tfp pilus assembly protein PilF
MSSLENFEKLLAGGQDSPLLRFSLGNEYLKAEDYAKACEHLAEAVRQKPDYSAAWKVYGKVLVAVGDSAAAIRAYEQGIEVAEQQGDKQAAKEMGVFLRRLQKQA